MNIELLERVKEHILAHPEEFDLSEWVCNTTACIAGHACLLMGYTPGHVKDDDCNTVMVNDGEESYLVPIRAQWLLNLNFTQSKRLFLSSQWPIEFCIRYEAARTSEESAKVTADRIDHFIATNGEE